MLTMRSMALALVLLSVGITCVYRSLVLNPIPLTPVPMHGKTVIVTGATSGIGQAAAILLASMNATVIITGRTTHSAEQAKTRIQAALPSHCTGTVEAWAVDLSSLASVRGFVERFAATGRPLHVLMNNAGMIQTGLQTTTDGIEVNYHVNHLAPFLLTELLLPVLKRSAPARVVFVSSAMNFIGNVNRTVYSATSRNADEATHIGAGVSGVYADSKLMNIIYSNSLNTRLSQSGVTSNAVHPGFVISKLDRGLEASWSAGFGEALRTYIARDTTEGAHTQVIVATAPALEGLGGLYVEDRCVDKFCEGAWNPSLQAQPGLGVKPNVQALDQDLQMWLDRTSRELTGLPQLAN